MELSGVTALTNAQSLVQSAGIRIAQGSLTPNDIVDLLKGREQFNAGTKLVQTEADMSKKLIDILA